jgi:hypothetical protein
VQKVLRIWFDDAAFADQGKSSLVKSPSESTTASEFSTSNSEAFDFEITDDMTIDIGLGDTVLPARSAEERATRPRSYKQIAYETTRSLHIDWRVADRRRWPGRVSSSRDDGSVCVELLDGSSEWHNIHRLAVVEDDERKKEAEITGFWKEAMAHIDYKTLAHDDYDPRDPECLVVATSEEIAHARVKLLRKQMSRLDVMLASRPQDKHKAFYEQALARMCREADHCGASAAAASL